MIDIGPSQNGTRPRLPIHVSAATIGAIASTIGVLVYAIGFISGALMLRQNVTDLRGGLVEIQSRLNIMERGNRDDREMLSTRLTKLESQAAYTAQGIADLKVLRAGTNR